MLAAEKTESHIAGEDLQFFEGCLPIEELARRGEDTLAFSCMKPVGLTNPLSQGKRAYAVIQFRREKAAGELLSMVGFQTRMKWPEQERVFRALPGMAQAQFVRLGAMHRNTFINAPLHLTDRLEMKRLAGIFLAGQITGSEGYTEALTTGHYAALQMLGLPLLPEDCAMRSLVRYLIHSSAAHFQPMNFNFGLLPANAAEEQAKMKRRASKPERNAWKSARALKELRSWKEKHFPNGYRIFSRTTSSSDPLVLTPIELGALISNA